MKQEALGKKVQVLGKPLLPAYLAALGLEYYQLIVNYHQNNHERAICVLTHEIQMQPLFLPNKLTRILNWETTWIWKITNH
jgi:hypothetical protein